MEIGSFGFGRVRYIVFLIYRDEERDSILSKAYAKGGINEHMKEKGTIPDAFSGALQ